MNLIVIYDAHGEEFFDGQEVDFDARILRSNDPSTGFRVVGADSGRPTLFGRHAPSPLGKARPGGNYDPVVFPLPDGGSVDVGASCADKGRGQWPDRRRFGSEIESLRRLVIGEKGDRSTVLDGLKDMKRRLAENEDSQRAGNPWEVRIGHGRLLEIELFAQAAALIGNSPERKVKAQLAAGVGCGWIAESDAGRLSESHTTLRSVMQVARLTVSDSFRPSEVGTGVIEFLLREVGRAFARTPGKTDSRRTRRLHEHSIEFNRVTGRPLRSR